MQRLLTEVLTVALSREFTYALYMPLAGGEDEAVRNLLALQGFAETERSGRTVLAVDMRQPIVLSRNVDTAIKAPLSSAPRVREAVRAAHRRLQASLTKLQPGCLVLSLSAGVIYHRMVQRITACPPSRWCRGSWGRIFAYPSARCCAAWRCQTR